ncbi:hypothetical protein SEPCBS57363_003373 [Sporothrix epigloea]|uniref:Prokaryotic-type class I peptide chain release factors domain-containing protein n=1 Tax=Sporothrix epigloea TaxID=1892477 RepID=A0ABP0DL44_9PEZI
MPRRATLSSTSVNPTRLFTVSFPARVKQMPSRPKPPPEDEIDEMFVKGTGPGGQKIVRFSLHELWNMGLELICMLPHPQNKTNSAVQLRHRPTGIVVKSQATRSRSQNRAIARSLLAARLDELWNGPVSRTAVVAVSKQKKKANATKKARRKYRKLEEEKDRTNLDDGGRRDECVEGLSVGSPVRNTIKAAVGASGAAKVGSAAGRLISVDEEDDDDVDEDSLIEEQVEQTEEEEEDEGDEDNDEDEEDQGEVWRVGKKMDSKRRSNRPGHVFL